MTPRPNNGGEPSSSKQQRKITREEKGGDGARTPPGLPQQSPHIFDMMPSPWLKNRRGFAALVRNALERVEKESDDGMMEVDEGAGVEDNFTMKTPTLAGADLQHYQENQQLRELHASQSPKDNKNQDGCRIGKDGIHPSYSQGTRSAANDKFPTYTGKLFVSKIKDDWLRHYAEVKLLMQDKGTVQQKAIYLRSTIGESMRGHICSRTPEDIDFNHMTDLPTIEMMDMYAQKVCTQGEYSETSIYDVVNKFEQKMQTPKQSIGDYINQLKTDTTLLYGHKVFEKETDVNKKQQMFHLVNAAAFSALRNRCTKKYMEVIAELQDEEQKSRHDPTFRFNYRQLTNALMDYERKHGVKASTADDEVCSKDADQSCSWFGTEKGCRFKHVLQTKKWKGKGKSTTKHQRDDDNDDEKGEKKKSKSSPNKNSKGGKDQNGGSGSGTSDHICRFDGKCFSFMSESNPCKFRHVVQTAKVNRSA